MLISNAVNAKDFRSNLGDLQNIAVKVKENRYRSFKAHLQLINTAVLARPHFWNGTRLS